MKKILFLSIGFAAAAFAGQDPCAQVNFFFSRRNNCTALFREATAPSKQPTEGVFNADTSYKKCFEPLKLTSLNKNALAQCRMSTVQNFDNALKTCVIKYWNKANCEAELAKAAGGNPDFLRDDAGSTLLLRAAENLNLQAFNFFLSKGADIHATDASGKNVLMYALSEKYPGDTANASLQEFYKDKRGKQLAMGKQILNAGVSPNEFDTAGWNALDYAMTVPGIDGVVDALLAAGVHPGVIVPKIFVSDSGKTSTELSSNFLRTFKSRGPYTEKIWNATKDWKGQLETYSKGASDSLFWSVAAGSPRKEISEETVIKAFSKGFSPNAVIAGNSVYLYFLMGDQPSFSMGLDTKSEKIAAAFVKAGLKFDELKLSGQSFSLLQLAIESGDTKLLTQQLSKKPDLKEGLVGASINLSGTVFEIPLNALEYAVAEGNPEIVKLLIKAKAPVKESFALGIAVLQDNVEIAKILISANANVNDKMPDGSALIENAKSETMKALLKKNGAVIPFSGSFIEYCKNSDLTEKDILAAIKDGADVNEMTSDGWTPLHSLAANTKNPKLIDILAKRGAFVNAMDENGYTPFLVAASVNTNVGVLKALVKNGANVTVEPSNGRGWNGLAKAVASNSNPAVVAELLRMGLAEDYDERKKNWLVCVAVVNNPNEKILIQLFKSGYKANPENSWWTNPLESAIEKQVDAKIITVLLQAHAKVTDSAIRAAQNLPVGRYRNELLDMLLKAKR